MIIPVIKQYMRYAAIAFVCIVAVSAIFGGDDEQMMYYSVNGQIIEVPMAPTTGGSMRVDFPNAYYDGQGTYEYNTRFGGGSRTSDGSWNHYSPLAGGAVGGTSDGCVYTSVAGGWSNC
ncbi:MAG: hypothetical protein ACR2QV_01440 [Gammaproteobacteria bacterium]